MIECLTNSMCVSLTSVAMRSKAWKWTINSGHDAPYRYIQLRASYIIYMVRSFTIQVHRFEYIDLTKLICTSETEEDVIVHNVKWMKVMRRCWIYIVYIVLQRPAPLFDS
jgi:hypothetical protein